MSRNPLPTHGSLNGWEDEVFADFVAGVAQEIPQHFEEAPARQADALKKALAKLATGTDRTSAKLTFNDSEAHSKTACPKASQSKLTGKGIQPAKMAEIDCPELTEAFLDDAARGIAALDQAVINYESNMHRDKALGTILRELHTLKGAAAVVGLTDVGRYLHDVEEFVSDSNASSEDVTAALLDCLQTLRNQAAKLARSAAEPQCETPDLPPAEPQNRIDAAVEGADAISVKGEQLDRLLDMLTALTMLNNQRDSHLDQLRDINTNLGQSSNRIRDLERILSKPGDDGQAAACLRSAGNPLREVANDLAEIGKLLLDTYSPIKQEHAAVSNFIRQFRQALVSILRMPVSGMFRRLQRSALDAARVERKQVRLKIVGSDAGLERSVQERLLDPLMHIVRNAVSHGIEAPHVRRTKGKDPVGTITLEAVSAPNLLTLTVRDDGQGLDYEALRRRGTELGLLQNGREPSREELGRLVFRRGFSTRQEANEVAGRGVGMDVVADTLEKLHAWVEIDSVPNEGTTIKLIVPLKSITEHALIVRVGEYLAAVPMQYVRSTHDAIDFPDQNYPQLAHVLGVPLSNEAITSFSLDQNHHAATSGVSTAVSCRVDEIIGPQEVVIRPLPPLLRQQKLLSGVTLSSDGSVVYVLDARQLAKSLHAIETGQVKLPASDQAIKSSIKTTKILIVDDSLSVRVSVKALCKQLGWESVEAPDGISALELLDSGDLTAVITDFDMPKMDGIQFVEALRSNRYTKDVPVLMVTSRPKRDLEAAAIDAGATHYLSKPLTIDRLAELIDTSADCTLVGVPNG